jgi:hypothetical protein
VPCELVDSTKSLADPGVTPFQLGLSFAFYGHEVTL